MKTCSSCGGKYEEAKDARYPDLCPNCEYNRWLAECSRRALDFVCLRFPIR